MKNASIAWIISSVLCSSLGHFMLKLGALRLNISTVVGDALLNKWLILGGALHVTALALWVIGLKRVDLSVAYPFIALGLVVVSALSWIFLREGVGLARLIGMLLISSGVVIISRT
jgi:drug/metabolite transporter (DMT)-like permease